MAQDAILQGIKKDAQKKDPPPNKKKCFAWNGKRVQLKSKAKACNEKFMKLPKKTIRA